MRRRWYLAVHKDLQDSRAGDDGIICRLGRICSQDDVGLSGDAFRDLVDLVVFACGFDRDDKLYAVSVVLYGEEGKKRGHTGESPEKKAA